MSPLDAGVDDRRKLFDLGYTSSEIAQILGLDDEEKGMASSKSKPVQSGGQVRMAEIFIHENSDLLRHVHGLGWHTWTGNRWKTDEERADIRAALATIKSCLAKLPDMQAGERDSLYKDVKRIESASAIEGMLKIAGSMYPISTGPSALDSDPYLFNTASGTLDLRTGQVRPAARRDLITKAAGGRIESEPESGEWEKFLARVLPDPEVRSYVQRLFGYAMLGKVTEHIMPIFTGTGANGKGTLRDAIMSAFGDYAIEVDPAILMESKHERHGTFKMRLRSARLVFCSETEKGRRFSEATMKRLVGGDPIEANLMHKDPITFDPSHLLLMLTNHLPTVSGDDPAVWRRISVVPFDVVIPLEERDPLLPERLKEDKTAVLTWVYQGWLDYQEQGLNPPEKVLKRTLEYQQDSDVLARFLEDRTMSTGSGTVKAQELFNAWTRWCSENKEEGVGNEKTFAKSMEARNFNKKRTAGGQVYTGLMLLSDDKD